MLGSYTVRSQKKLKLSLEKVTQPCAIKTKHHLHERNLINFVKGRTNASLPHWPSDKFPQHVLYYLEPGTGTSQSAAPLSLRHSLIQLHSLHQFLAYHTGSRKLCVIRKEITTSIYIPAIRNGIKLLIWTILINPLLYDLYDFLVPLFTRHETLRTDS